MSPFLDSDQSPKDLVLDGARSAKASRHSSPTQSTHVFAQLIRSPRNPCPISSKMVSRTTQRKAYVAEPLLEQILRPGRNLLFLRLPSGSDPNNTTNVYSTVLYS
jgi:hypothetical protein